MLCKLGEAYIILFQCTKIHETKVPESFQENTIDKLTIAVLQHTQFYYILFVSDSLQCFYCCSLEIDKASV